MKSRAIINEILYLILFLLMACLFFYKNPAFSYLQMGDVLVWEFQNIKDSVLNGIYTWENSYFKMPIVRMFNIHPRNLLLTLLSIPVFIQSSLIMHIFAFGYGMFLFLRQKKLSTTASIFGGIALMFTNNFITLILPGHLGKFETYAYFPFVLYFLLLAMQTGLVRYFIFTGASLGIAFLGGALDVASYFSVFTGVYFLYLLYKRKEENRFFIYIKKDYKKILLFCAKFIIVIVFSFGMASQSIMHIRKTTDQGAYGVTNKKELYDWATRWSFPPEEIVSFFAPGLFGYYSGSETHPYWGRMARMDGDPKNFNFSHVTTNISVIACIFILFAFIAPRLIYKDKFFWICSTVFLLSASFGRYFPFIFNAVFSIPVFQSARNPNKFLDIAVIPMAVLAAYGADYIITLWKANRADTLLYELNKDNQYKKTRVVNYIIFAAALVSLFMAALTLILNDNISTYFVSLNYNIDVAKIIAKNITLAFIRLFLLSSAVFLIIRNVISLSPLNTIDKYIPALPILLFALFAIYDAQNIVFFLIAVMFIFAYILMITKDKIKNALPCLCIFILILDLWQSADIFIRKVQTEKFYGETPITDAIKDRKGNNLTMPLPHGYINAYMTHTFPSMRIRLVDPPAASRMDKEVEAFFRNFQIQDYYRYQPRLYSMLGVRYFLSPVQMNISTFIQDLNFITNHQNEYSLAYLYELKEPRGRFEFAAKTYKAKDFSDSMNIIMTPGFDYTKEAVVYDDKYVLSDTNSVNYKAEITVDKPNFIEALIETDRKGVLVLKEFYDKDWHVFVNGKQEELIKINGIFRGVAIDEGRSSVVYKYMPSMRYFYVTLASYIILFTAIIISVIIGKKNSWF